MTYESIQLFLEAVNLIFHGVFITMFAVAVGHIWYYWDVDGGDND